MEAPVFNPAAGTYTSAQSVTITSATSGATIRYTTDGSTPSQTTARSIPRREHQRHDHVEGDRLQERMSDSSVTSGTYTILLPVEAPVFNPAPARTPARSR